MLKLVEAPEPFVSDFKATRTKNDLTIYYKDTLFYSIFYSHELTNDEIKNSLRCALWMKYFGSEDIKEILESIGEYYSAEEFNKDML